MLKAITLRQPYAGAMALGLKHNETRGRRCNYRGELAIHSASTPRYKHGDAMKNLRTVLLAWSKSEGNEEIFLRAMTNGAILCVVDLYDCIGTDFFFDHDGLLWTDKTLLVKDSVLRLSKTEHALGDYSSDRFVLLTRNLRVLHQPVLCRGYQSIPWTVPPEVEATVRKQLLTTLATTRNS